ncbi:Rha family transcriptional regulator [Shewanella baltica]|uniref:Rha family transcriptional regulator n=1 Tax=Shewanella baltica TaxID=62322 RepID=UPI00217EBBF4|nr:Rha family transcriptional regulator [Shewanella baltica]MCS6258848.1 Rha family transcriptional regulator [Shewanella baltica]
MNHIALLPNDAVIEHHGDVRTTSVKIAEIFGKRHDNVLRKIDSLECSQEFRRLNFEETFQTVDMPRGAKKKILVWNITKDGFMFLVMGFTGKAAAAIKEAYIERFNAMAQRLQQLSASIAITHKNQPPKPPRQYASYQAQCKLTHTPLPEYFDSNWIPARIERCHVPTFWIWHVRVVVQPTASGKHGACISFGIGNQDGTTPRFTRQHNVFSLPDVNLVFRNIDELWENIHEHLAKYNASLDIRQYRMNA